MLTQQVLFFSVCVFHMPGTGHNWEDIAHVVSYPVGWRGRPSKSISICKHSPTESQEEFIIILELVAKKRPKSNCDLLVRLTSTRHQARKPCKFSIKQWYDLQNSVSWSFKYKSKHAYRCRLLLIANFMMHWTLKFVLPRGVLPTHSRAHHHWHDALPARPSTIPVSSH